MSSKKITPEQIESYRRNKRIFKEVFRVFDPEEFTRKLSDPLLGAFLLLGKAARQIPPRVYAKDAQGNNVGEPLVGMSNEIFLKFVGDEENRRTMFVRSVQLPPDPEDTQTGPNGAPIVRYAVADIKSIEEFREELMALVEWSDIYKQIAATLAGFDLEDYEAADDDEDPELEAMELSKDEAIKRLESKYRAENE